MPQYYIVSSRAIWDYPAQGCLIEFEDILVDCCEGELITPVLRQPSNRFISLFDRFNPPFQVNISPRNTTDKQVLFILGIAIGFVPQVLSSIPNWRSRFDIVCAYIFDAFIPKDELEKSPWKKRFSKFTSLISSLDYLFIPMTGNLQSYQELYGIPVSMIPMACDVLKFGSSRIDRSIDLMGYGRQNYQHSRILASFYNSPESPRIYYHTDHMNIRLIHNFYEHRNFFWKLLSRSQIALAYDALDTNPVGRFSFSFVGQRWFESITAGCLIVGRRPTCPEVNDLLYWKDATVEVPDHDEDLIPFIESLLTDKERLEAAHYRNYAYALTYHDWRYRIANMLDCLKLPYPQSLQRNLDSLELHSQKLYLE